MSKLKVIFRSSTWYCFSEGEERAFMGIRSSGATGVPDKINKRRRNLFNDIMKDIEVDLRITTRRGVIYLEYKGKIIPYFYEAKCFLFNLIDFDKIDGAFRQYSGIAEEQSG